MLPSLPPGLRAARVRLHRIPEDPVRRECVQGVAEGEGRQDRDGQR